MKWPRSFRTEICSEKIVLVYLMMQLLPFHPLCCPFVCESVSQVSICSHFLLHYLWEKIALLSIKLLITTFLEKVLLLDAVICLYLPIEVWRLMECY